MPFDGETYDAEKDRARLAAQLGHVRELMLDGQARTLGEIHADLVSRCGASYPEASISARLRDLRKPKFGGYVVARTRVPGVSGLHTYQITGRVEVPAKVPGQIPLFPPATPNPRARSGKIGAVLRAAVMLRKALNAHTSKASGFCAPGATMHPPGTPHCREVIRQFDQALEELQGSGVAVTMDFSLTP